MKFSEYLNNINIEEPINEKAFSIDKVLKSTIKALERFNVHFAQLSSASDGNIAYRLVTNKTRMSALINFDFNKNDVDRLKLETSAIEAGATYYKEKEFADLLTTAGNEFLDLTNAVHETIELFKEVSNSGEDTGVAVEHFARKLGLK